MFAYKKEEFQVPIKVWMKEEDYYSDEGMVKQTENLANLPFAFHHITLSADGHLGYGMPIGGVLATHGVVICNAVGLDIGCGMSSMKTSLTEISKEDLKKIMGLIRQRIPVGFAHHKEKQDESLMPAPNNLPKDSCNNICGVINYEYFNALTQIGTLGGGNHFLEIQKGSDGHVWVMIHSGSRNLGKQVADHYNKIAVTLNEKWFSQVEKSKQLAFLPVDTKEAKMYMAEMNYCVDFAFANRKLMMERMQECFKEIIPDANIISFAGDTIVNIAHNYARWENHFGQNVIVHRKGATSAKLGEIGIIPSSQGSKSYIVEGLGNTESFMSCSHGAGRRMGRKQAQRELNLEDEIKRMNEQGIIHGMRHVNDLDEAAGAYKNIETVMANQADLVKILIEFLPLAVIKG